MLRAFIFLIVFEVNYQNLPQHLKHKYSKYVQVNLKFKAPLKKVLSFKLIAFQILIVIFIDQM